MTAAQNTMPIEFKKAIDVACAIKSEHFFMSGGCAVFAALLAEVAHAKGESGTFYLIYRTLGGDFFLQHVCFNHKETQDLYDIRGSDAEAKLINPIINDARQGLEKVGYRESYIEDMIPSFDYDIVSIYPDKTVFEFLKDFTDFFKTRVTSRWIDSHYESLRDQVLDASGLRNAHGIAS